MDLRIMDRSIRAVVVSSLAALFCLPVSSQAQGLPSIQQVQLLRGQGQVEIEIQTSVRAIPQTHLISNPDRLVVDFVNAVPGHQLRNLAVNRREVKSLRVGLFSSNPPVTRLVLDLSGPQPYQVFPSGRTVIVKVGGSDGPATAAFHPASGPALVKTNFASQPTIIPEPAPLPAKPPLQVSFHDGLLTIDSEKANLSEVLFAVHQRTGAEIAIPAGAEQEKVVANVGPGPAPEVLAHLLNGSKFNFLILSSSSDPHTLDRVILSSRPEGPMPQPRPQPQQQVTEDEEEVQTKPAPRSRATAAPADNSNPANDPPAPPAGAPEIKPPTNNEVPD